MLEHARTEDFSIIWRVQLAMPLAGEEIMKTKYDGKTLGCCVGVFDLHVSQA